MPSSNDDRHNARRVRLLFAIIFGIPGLIIADLCFYELFHPRHSWTKQADGHYRSQTFGDSGRGKCVSNLHQIGLGIMLYCGEYKGDYPDNLQTLFLKEQLTPDLFICPSSTDIPTTAPTPQAQAEEMTVGSHKSYIYLGKGLTDKIAASNWIIAYDSPDHHYGEMNVLLGNGDALGLNAMETSKVLAAVKAGSRPLTLPP